MKRLTSFIIALAIIANIACTSHTDVEQDTFPATDLAELHVRNNNGSIVVKSRPGNGADNRAGTFFNKVKIWGCPASSRPRNPMSPADARYRAVQENA